MESLKGIEQMKKDKGFDPDYDTALKFYKNGDASGKPDYYEAIKPYMSKIRGIPNLLGLAGLKAISQLAPGFDNATNEDKVKMLHAFLADFSGLGGSILALLK